jgi:hypothetical protein
MSINIIDSMRAIKSKRLVAYTTQEFVNEIENYMRSHHFNSRNSAVMSLLEKGLENSKVADSLDARIRLLEQKLASDEHAYYKNLERKSSSGCMIRSG